MREFPPFRLDTVNQCLWRGDAEAPERIVLPPKAFAVLQYLVEHPGRLVTHDELFESLWPKTFVQPEVLKTHIAAIRTVLGDDARNPVFVETLSRRGYRFIAAVREGASARPSRTTNLPEPVSELIGREAELAAVTALATEHRLVSLIGAGGIGKTRLGLEVARRLLPRFPDGVFVAELGPLSSPDLVPATVASALGITHVAGTLSHEGVAEAVGTKTLVLVIDNCEHVIEAAARMAEALLRASPGVSLVATSREPLRVSGEYVYRVPSLDVPAQDTQDMEDVFRYGAVRLFVSRARAAEPRYVAEGPVAAATAAICRRLDGIPLAIELAATRIAAFGVDGVAAHLDDRFRLLTGGSRTALPRHQTLRATLDWSYDLLSDPERVVLRRLAVFAGWFTLDAAAAIAASPEIGAEDVIECVVDLVGKSLVSADVGGAAASYRLLETTRAYAREKLGDSGELERFERRHADYHVHLFERAEAERETKATAEWLGDYGRQIDDLRAALDWAFSLRGDPVIGVALTVSAVPLWIQLSLMSECRTRVETALSRTSRESSQSEHARMRLHAALGVSLLYTRGNAPETMAAWSDALVLAERLGNPEFQLRALFGLWTCRVSIPECQAALELAQRFFSVAAEQANSTDLPIGDRMIGVSLHYQGDQVGARHHIERMLGGHLATTHRARTIRFQVDQHVAARAFLARILWLQGFADEAMRTADSNVDEARAIGHELSLCYALEAAAAVALFAGDLSTAERFRATLLGHAEKHGFAAWHAWGGCVQGTLHVKRGEVPIGVSLLRTALEELRRARFAARYTHFLGTLAESLGLVGKTDEGLATIDEALARSERNDEGWCIAELSRIKGELLVLGGSSAAVAEGEQHFREALSCANRQGALAWELRAATSLARFWLGQQRVSQARKVLEPVYRRFTEGFETTDLIAAKALLALVR